MLDIDAAVTSILGVRGGAGRLARWAEDGAQRLDEETPLRGEGRTLRSGAALLAEARGAVLGRVALRAVVLTSALLSGLIVTASASGVTLPGRTCRHGCVPSTSARRSSRAVATIDFSARRRSMPGMGIFSSTARR